MLLLLVLVALLLLAARLHLLVRAELPRATLLLLPLLLLEPAPAACHISWQRSQWPNRWWVSCVSAAVGWKAQAFFPSPSPPLSGRAHVTCCGE